MKNGNGSINNLVAAVVVGGGGGGGAVDENGTGIVVYVGRVGHIWCWQSRLLLLLWRNHHQTIPP